MAAARRRNTSAPLSRYVTRRTVTWRDSFLSPLTGEWPSAPDTEEDGAVLPAGMSLVNGQSVSGVQAGTLPQWLKSRLPSLLMLNRGFGNGMSTADNGQVISQGVLADGRVTRLAAAYASAVSDFELRLPTENTPAQWQAGLSVTVTVQ